MGTYVRIEIESVVIPAANVEAAHEAMKALWTDKPTGWLLRRRETSLRDPEDWRGYDWVMYKEGGYPTLVEELDAWRYKASVLLDGAVRIDRWRGEKWGDDEAFYRAIAPFTRGVGSIHVVGEDHHEWRYLFEDGVLRLESRYKEDRKPWTEWASLPFWGEGPEREQAIEHRARWKKMDRELRRSEERQAREQAAKPPPLKSDVPSERETAPTDPMALRLWGVRRRGVQ